MQIQTMEERRHHERLPIMMKAALMLDEQTLEVMIFDISGGGAKIRIDSDNIPSDDKVASPVVLEVPTCGEIEGHIIWKDEEYFGLRFDENHSKLISLLTY